MVLVSSFWSSAIMRSGFSQTSMYAALTPT